VASQTLDGLRALERSLTAYHGLYRKYLHSVTEGNVTEVRAVLKKMEKLRAEMAQQYGQAREAIIAAVGGESRVQTGYRDLGGTFTMF